MGSAINPMLSLHLMAHGNGISGRDTVRPCLSALLGCPAEGIQFGEGPNGKPFLRDYPGVHISISHSQGLLALAVGGTDLGVDLEWNGRSRDWQAIAAGVFGPEEAASLALEQDPRGLFYRIWTAKEAWLKARAMSVWDVGRTPDFFPGDPRLSQWLVCPEDAGTENLWTLSLWQDSDSPANPSIESFCRTVPGVYIRQILGQPASDRVIGL